MKKDPSGRRRLGLDFHDELVVRLAGIEPTTPWFVAKYSIQLSYSRDGPNYNSSCPNRKEGIRRRGGDACHT
jgi:hypothetical protein